jgi:hypothetical protein
MAINIFSQRELSFRLSSIYTYLSLKFNIMKKILLSIFVFMLVSAVAALYGQSIDGNWKGKRQTPNGEIEIFYTFKAEGSVLTGTWKSTFGEAALSNGKINDKAISYTVSINGNDIEFTGEIVSATEIKVTNTRGEMVLSKVE